MTRLELVPRTDRFFSLLPDFDVFDRFFDNTWLSDSERGISSWVPAFDISETETEYVITGEVPGIEAKDLDITLKDGILSIKGEKKHETEDKDKNYHHVERYYGSFSRSFRFSDRVKTDGLDATYKDGVLRLTLPKSEESKTKKIEVK